MESHVDGTSINWRALRDTLLHTYSQVYFAESKWLGAALLLCTFLAPAYGAVGFTGVLIAWLVAHWWGLEAAALRSGGVLFNSLLASLAVAHVAHTCQVTWALVLLLLLAASALSVVLNAGLSAWCQRYLGTSALSLPFAAVHFLLYGTVAWYFKSYPQPWFAVPAIDVGSGLAKCYLESFGAITFLSHTTVGVLVWLAVFCWSRLAVLFASAAFAAGMAALALLPSGVALGEASFIAFNFVFCGIALGGVLVIPTRGSLLLAVAAAAGCALVAVAERNFLGAFGVPPMALVFNLVVLVTVYGLQQRSIVRGVHLASSVQRPEEHVRQHASTEQRFPDRWMPGIRCPFAGERVVTQSFDGSMTHRSTWKYALDYELHDADGSRATNTTPELGDFYTFNTPVLAPEAGYIVRTIRDIDDRVPGANNFGDNWGNLVIMQLDNGLHLSLCHLKQGSIRVVEGQRVQPGELLGFCGNSGRSPVPHLHVQLQTLPLVGAPSVAFRQRHYLEQTDDGWRYCRSGIPAEGARIRDAVPSRQAAECFDNLGSRRDRYQVVAGDRTWQEEIACRVNERGDYEFGSSRGGMLTARILDHAFYVLEYQSPGASMLDWIWLGLAHMPLIETDHVHWREQLELYPLLTRASQWAALSIAPFANLPALNVERSFGGGNSCDIPAGGLEVAATIDAPRCVWPHREVPRQVITRITRGGWIQSMTVEMAGGMIEVHPVGEQQPTDVSDSPSEGPLVAECLAAG